MTRPRKFDPVSHDTEMFWNKARGRPVLVQPTRVTRIDLTNISLRCGGSETTALSRRFFRVRKNGPEVAHRGPPPKLVRLLAFLLLRVSIRLLETFSVHSHA